MYNCMLVVMKQLSKNTVCLFTKCYRRHVFIIIFYARDYISNTSIMDYLKESASLIQCSSLIRYWTCRDESRLCFINAINCLIMKQTQVILKWLRWGFCGTVCGYTRSHQPFIMFLTQHTKTNLTLGRVIKKIRRVIFFLIFKRY